MLYVIFASFSRTYFLSRFAAPFGFCFVSVLLQPLDVTSTLKRATTDSRDGDHLDLSGETTLSVPVTFVLFLIKKKKKHLSLPEAWRCELESGAGWSEAGQGLRIRWGVGAAARVLGAGLSLAPAAAGLNKYARLPTGHTLPAFRDPFGPRPA